MIMTRVKFYSSSSFNQPTPSSNEKKNINFFEKKQKKAGRNTTTVEMQIYPSFQ